MPGITQRSTREPALKVRRIGHGTLGVTNLAKTRRWYEEVLGLDVVQTSPRSLMVRKGTAQCYAVVEGPRANNSTRMDPLNHNGLELESREAVVEAHKKLAALKDEYELKQISEPTIAHGDFSFMVVDLDGNWWEFLHAGEKGYSEDFEDPDRDITGLYALESAKGVKGHTHDPEFRQQVKKERQAAADLNSGTEPLRSHS
jgi:catechol 2,3-dioxygenase-like lactoylglutathione lyase family enzyme